METEETILACADLLEERKNLRKRLFELDLILQAEQDKKDNVLNRLFSIQRQLLAIGYKGY